jgi:ATP-dependent Lhr-like helicase
LKWPAFSLRGASTGQASAGRGPTRSVGATVVLVDGALAGYLARGDRQLTTFLPDVEPERSTTARAVARALADRARGGVESPRGMLIEEIDGAPPSGHPITAHLVEAGFVAGAMGLQAAPHGRPISGARLPSPPGAQPQARGRPAAVSSPFARRYFDADTSDEDDA